ncbi:MAG: hypothetical protein JKX78_09890 [Alteromonadaceae bacterium]|nr:hypothetical protein [Alteromonadaceae bacterium]
MLAISSTEAPIERRQYYPDLSVLWDKLTLAQKFAASSLNQFGYDLAFVRSSEIGCMAILLSNENSIATVMSDGDINTSPDIQIRL